MIEAKMQELESEADIDQQISEVIEKAHRESEPVLDSNFNQLKIEKEVKTCLSQHFEDYAPAKNINELEDQVWQAKNNDCDSIEATEAIVRHYCKGPLYPERTGYFIYKDIKVYIAGWSDKTKDKQTMEEKLFPKK